MDKAKARRKARELVSQMTVEEKLSQLLYASPAVERLGIYAYNWWNEAAHGVARAGTATVFPQAIGMAATFNPELIGRVGDAVSSEARAKYNKSIRFGDRGIYKGLTYWTPNINIFRDGRWGRGQETFGEDPFLTSDMGAAYARGLQGDGEFLKAAACAKHFAVHSGPEYARHSFDAKVSMKDLWETYLPAFEQMVKAGVMGVMGAYNRTNGEPCCAHSYLMQEALFKKWGFDGYFVSDCGAVSDICFGHHVTDTLTEAAALALSKGCVLNCGSAYDKLLDAYEMDLITEEEITAAVEKLYTVRALLGEFEDERPYADVPFSVLDCPEHRALNLRTAEESLVLLRNENGFLPMRDGAFARIAVVGPCANSLTVLEGNYNGAAAEYVTVAEGMRRVFGRAEITVASGSPICADYNWTSGDDLRSEGLAAASEADVTVLCLGLDRTFEGEEMNVENESFFHGDRVSFRLPPAQQKLAEAVCDVCRNVVVLVFCGSPVDLGEKVNARVRAIVHGWYPGALGGLAAARLLHGDFSPSGRLPITFPRAETPLPDFSDYSMAGRTYRYLNEKPLFPFGFGLSYTTFRYGGARVLEADDARVKLEFTVTNAGDRDGLEKSQVYAQFSDSRTETPRYQLCAVVPVACAAGETKTVTAEIDRYWLSAVLSDGTRTAPDGGITLWVGGRQPDERSAALSGTSCLAVPLP